MNEDCNDPEISHKPPDGIYEPWYVDYIWARSVMVPFSVTLKIEDSSGNFEYIDGKAPINKYGELECKNYSDIFPNLGNTMIQSHTLYRTVEKIQEEDLEVQTRAYGKWEMLMSGQVISYEETIGFLSISQNSESVTTQETFNAGISAGVGIAWLRLGPEISK